MKISIDQEGCTECGECVSACSEVFELKDGEKANIVEKYQSDSPATGEVDDGLKDCVQDAVDSCPVDVINVE
ncbi:MAG: ferredoxin [Candidatus Thermoplasmatota archaeon]|nr:ferredoxin [Candidatus Thermoplasmatota archaeon]